VVWLCNTLSHFNKYGIEPKGFLIYLERGIAHALSNFRHEQYHYDSMDQNNSAHDVYKILA